MKNISKIPLPGKQVTSNSTVRLVSEFELEEYVNASIKLHMDSIQADIDDKAVDNFCALLRMRGESIE